MRSGRLTAFLTAALVAVLCFGQASRAQSVIQGGPAIGGHPPMYQLGPGQGFAAVMDSGFASGLSAAGTQTGAGLSELLQVNHSPGSGVFGTHVSFHDADAISGSYHGLSFDSNALGGGLISYDAFGAATPLPLKICANGTCLQFPFAIGGIVGPNPSVIGDIPTFGNTTGTLLNDSLVPVTSLGRFATQFGADVTGATDATTAVQACLNAAGVGNTCHINGTVKLAGTVTIPGGTVLDGGVQSGAGLNDPAVPLLLTGPRIMTDPNHPILFGGTSATLQNFVQVPIGMTFPQVTSSGWVGTAIDTHGASAPQIINGAIAGFDTCIDTTTNGGSLRPLLRRIWYDCNGVANASIVTGNGGDLATIEDVSGQPLATAVTTCARVRQGTGFWLKGSAWGSRLIVQDYQIAQVKITDTGGIIFGSIWVDDTRGLLGCSFPSDTGVIISNVNDVSIGHLDLNQQQTGMLISNQNPNQVTHIGDVFLNGTNQDGIAIGAASGDINQRSAGAVQIDMLNTNQFGNNVGRFVLNYLDNFASDTSDGLTGNTTLTINGGLILGGNGHAAPYINFPTTTDAFRIHISPSLLSDLAPANAIYGAPTVSCTGLGGSGTCAIMGNVRTSPWNVFLSMVAQAGAAAAGTATVTFPISASFPSCVASYQGGWGTPLATLTLAPTSARAVQLNWGQTAPLTPGNSYGLSVNCAVN